MMPLFSILIVEILYVWSVDFMGPFPPSFCSIYILVAVEYVSKWVEALATTSSDHKVVVKFMKEYISCQCGTPEALVSNGCSHFCHQLFEALLQKYFVTHKVTTCYHP